MTYQEALELDTNLRDATPPLTASIPPTARMTLPTPKRPAKNGYLTYKRTAGPGNSAPSHAGWGETPTESARSALYWANQMPWVVTVRADAAPQWARDEADEAAFRSGE